MKERAGKMAGAFVLAVVIGGAAAGCVRLDAPTSFTCDSPSDCADGERCSFGVCLGEGECRRELDCGGSLRCDVDKRRCVDAECYPGHDDVCGDHACVAGRCKQGPCTGSGDCRESYTCDVLTARCKPPPRARGESCAPSDECVIGLTCCGPSGDTKCGSCYPDYAPCSSAAECAGRLCCETASGKSCGTGSCVGH